nr:MAG TPA: Caspase 1 [Caudoviricetes sp.]
MFLIYYSTYPESAAPNNLINDQVFCRSLLSLLGFVQTNQWE